MDFMINNIIDWVIRNWVEITGAILGMAYIFFSVKQQLVTWLLGLLTSALYIYVFFVSKFYADMALQVYYVVISLYGWILWARGIQSDHHRIPLQVTTTNRNLALRLLLISLVLFVVIGLILNYLTDSPIPIGDAFTTAFSIVATWMLAKKKIEHWLVWIVVDLVSLALYIYKDLYATALLFLVYTLAAVWGYFEWKKELKPVLHDSH